MITEQSKKNTDEPFVMEKVYDSPVEKVWSALTEKDAMKEWYFPQILAFEPVLGFKFQFAGDGSPYQKDWQATWVEAGRKLAHSWAYKDYPGYSEVIFDISGYGDQTLLKLTHTRLASFPDEPHFARKRFEDGWTNLLGHNLNRYLEDHRPDHSKA